MALYLCLAASCKEDVSLVILGFGIVLWTLGRRRAGVVVAVVSIAYFVVVTQVVMRLVNGGSGSIYFQRNYGIEGSGPAAILFGLPGVFGNLLGQTFSLQGAEYLALAFAPFLFLSLIGGRWLLPIAAPLCLNLASLVPYQHEISYHYLATSAPFLAIAALAGVRRVQRWHVPLPLVLGVMLFVAAGVSYSEGARSSIVGPLMGDHRVAAQYDVLRSIPANAAVSADYSLDTHLVNRRVVYEFPNPFRPANWGADDVPVTQDKIDEVEYIVIDRSLLGDEDVTVAVDLQKSDVWETQYDDGVLLLLHRRIA
jgi:uncharacterized membrane protein